MELHETIADVHTVAVSTGDTERVFVHTSDGWRCCRYSRTGTATLTDVL